MTDYSLNHPAAITESTRTTFLQYLVENPSPRRVSQTEKHNLIEWLNNPEKRPTSQKESSRRNYARKTFTWDETTKSLLAVRKGDEKEDRKVITEDMIAEVVETVHRENGHAGWDTTWKDVSSSYYGILRSDVIFLLKQCQICTNDPRKRPKNSTVSMSDLHLVDDSTYNFMNMDDLFFDNLSLDLTSNENQPSL